MTGGSCGPSVTIPVVMISQADGQRLLPAICSGGVISLKNSAYVTGNIFADRNVNCVQDSGEQGIPNVQVQAVPQGNFALSDQDGLYSLPVDNSSTAISITPPGHLTSVVTSICPSQTIALPTGITDSSRVVQDIGIRGNDCFQYELRMTGRLRFCASNRFYLGYYNNGFGGGPSATIRIHLPPPLVLGTTSLPFSIVSPGVYECSVGSLPSFSTDVVSFDVSVPCDTSLLNDAFCLNAFITPVGNCTPPSAPGWDGSRLRLKAVCMPGQPGSFSVLNIGQAMTDSVPYALNNILLRVPQTGKLKLNAGDSVHIVQRTPHNFASLMLRQRPNNPEGSAAALMSRAKKTPM